MIKEKRSDDNSLLPLTFAGLFFAGFYVMCSLISNVLSTKIVLLPLIGQAVDGGTVLYPLVFVVRDMLHKTVGRRLAIKVVFSTSCLVAFMALLFYAVGALPADPSWAYQDAYNHILLPVVRVIFASIVSETISNLLNTYIFSAIIRRGGTYDIVASISSNIAAALVDSVVFSMIAFMGAFPLSVVFQIIVMNLLFKGVVAVVFSPLIRLVKPLAPRDSL